MAKSKVHQNEEGDILEVSSLVQFKKMNFMNFFFIN